MALGLVLDPAAAQPMITAAVPISAIVAVLGFMLGIMGSFIDQKPKVAQVST